MAKYVLQVTGQEAKAAYGIEQLVGGVKEGIKGGYTLCAYYGHSTPRRRAGDFYSLMRITHPMSRTEQQYCGPSDMNSPVACSLHLTVTAIGPTYWYAIWRTGQATPCITRRV